MRLEHHLVGGYVRYISPHIIIIIIIIIKGAVSSRSGQTFNRAWNRLPSLRSTQRLKITHLCSSNGNMTLSRGVLWQSLS